MLEFQLRNKNISRCSSLIRERSLEAHVRAMEKQSAEKASSVVRPSTDDQSLPVKDLPQESLKRPQALRNVSTSKQADERSILCTITLTSAWKIVRHSFMSIVRNKKRRSIKLDGSRWINKYDRRRSRYGRTCFWKMAVNVLVSVCNDYSAN